MRYLRHMIAAALGTAVLFSGTSAQAAPLFDFSAAPDTFTPSSITLGYQFQVMSGSSITVDGIGLFDIDPDGLGSAHEVALWDIDETPLIDPAMLNGGTSTARSERSTSSLGSYIFVDLDAPLVLGEGVYVLGASYLPRGSGPDQNRDLAVNMPVGIAPDPSVEGVVDYLGGVWGFALGVNVMFPAFSGGDENYFGPALRIPSTIPEPLTVALLIIGIVALGCNRRRGPQPGDSLPG
jgi:hypothetical protein